MYASPRAKEPDHVGVQRWDPSWDPITLDPRRYEKEKLQVRDYAATRALLNQLYSHRGKLLEVGGGLGFLLAEFRRDGWDVLNVEPNASYCRFAKEELGINSVGSILEEVGIPDSSYDVVIMNHVIEHLGSPLATLKEINRVLKPSGHLVVETPRYDTLMFKLLGRRERSINCIGHIYFFTTQTLKKFYEAAGFQTVQLDYVGRSLTVERLLWNVGVVSKNQRVSRWLTQGSRKLGLNNIRVYLNLRDIQRVCVQKIGSAPGPGSSVAASTGKPLV